MRLKNKVALVTGGASGIGKATAIRMLQEGAIVIITDIDVVVGESCIEELNALDLEALFIHQDVSLAADWTRVAESILHTFGKLDILVNNAGIVKPLNIEQETLSSWQQTMAVNVDSVFLGTQTGIRLMKEKGGSIINMSSIEGIRGEAQAIAYTASKGAVRNFTKSAALHCAKMKYGIRVNSLHPGFINTPMVANAIAKMENGDAFVQATLQKIPMGELGEAVDIANGVVFLASNESRYMTGSELVIDGGYLA